MSAAILIGSDGLAAAGRVDLAGRTACAAAAGQWVLNGRIAYPPSQSISTPLRFGLSRKMTNLRSDLRYRNLIFLGPYLHLRPHLRGTPSAICHKTVATSIFSDSAFEN